MTRKGYRQMADALRREKPLETEGEMAYGEVKKRAIYIRELLVWRACVKAVAEVLKDDNASFRFDKFYAACDYDPNVTARDAALGTND